MLASTSARSMAAVRRGRLAVGGAAYSTAISSSMKQRRIKTGEEVSVSGHPNAAHVATPRPPPFTPTEQAPNREMVWSKAQNPRSNAMRGPRFEQTVMELQPQPLAAIELIAEEPIRLVPARIAACDGGGGALGHPKVFINLDKPGPKACGYCGIRFEREVQHHH